MKTRTRTSWILLLFVLVACGMVSGVRALVPQPMCIIYGMAKDDFGWPYLRDAEVFLKVNGVEISRYQVNGILDYGVNFILKAPLDSGGLSEAYSPFAVTNGARIEIGVEESDGRVRSIMETNALPRVGVPGEMLYVNVTAGDDSDQDGLPDEFEVWILTYSSSDGTYSLEHVAPYGDFDGDGASNRDELMSGTDPAWITDCLRAEQFLPLENGRIEIPFYTIPGKTYRPLSSSNLVLGAWAPVAFAETPEGSLGQTHLIGDGFRRSFFVEMSTGPEYFAIEVR